MCPRAECSRFLCNAAPLLILKTIARAQDSAGRRAESGQVRATRVEQALQHVICGRHSAERATGHGGFSGGGSGGELFGRVPDPLVSTLMARLRRPLLLGFMFCPEGLGSAFHNNREGGLMWSSLV